jgi:hypothetical protein
VLLLLGLLGGSPEPLNATRFDCDLIQGVEYALIGAAFRAGSWALRRSDGGEVAVKAAEAVRAAPQNCWRWPPLARADPYSCPSFGGWQVRLPSHEIV